jgi:hypothetical protein
MRRFKLVNGEGWEDLFEEGTTYGGDTIGKGGHSVEYYATKGNYASDWEEVFEGVLPSPIIIYTVIPFFEGTNDMDFSRVKSFKDNKQAHQYRDSLISIEYSYLIQNQLT